MLLRSDVVLERALEIKRKREKEERGDEDEEDKDKKNDNGVMVEESQNMKKESKDENDQVINPHIKPYPTRILRIEGLIPSSSSSSNHHDHLTYQQVAEIEKELKNEIVSSSFSSSSSNETNPSENESKEDQESSLIEVEEEDVSSCSIIIPPPSSQGYGLVFVESEDELKVRKKEKQMKERWITNHHSFFHLTLSLIFSHMCFCSH